MTAQPNPNFDPNDPHGFADLGEHHGHHIASVRMLVVVILALVALTGLTVFASAVETYLVTNMGWTLPGWVNIAVAMSIALVKGSMVLMIFMALRYENPLYTIIFLFCMFAFALFLGLTGMDLDNRGHVYPWKSPPISEGGTGVSIQHGGADMKIHHAFDEELEFEPFAFTGSLAGALKDKYIEQQGISEAEYWRRWAEVNHAHDHHHDVPDANHTFARTGLTDALSEEAHHDGHGHADDHGDDHADDHGDADHSDDHGEDHADEAHAEDADD